MVPLLGGHVLSNRAGRRGPGGVTALEMKMGAWSFKEKRRFAEIAASSKSFDEIVKRTGRSPIACSQGSAQTRGQARQTDCFGQSASGRAEGEEMKADMRQRSVMQNLSLTEWRSLTRLPVSAGPLMLDGIHRLRWIELRGMNARKEIRLTQLGLEALRAPV